MEEPGRLVIIGHSHTACLVDATWQSERFDVVNFWHTPGILARAHDEPRLSDEILARLRPPLLTMMGGGAHVELGLAEHPRPFDFVLPAAPDIPLAPDAEILPYDAVRRRLEIDVKQYLELTELVLRSVRGAIYHVDAPPPVADGEFIRPHVPWQYFPGRKQAIADKWHRLRMWRLNSDVAREHARRNGIGFISHPLDAQDVEGFLDKSFSSDGIHANAAYGNLLARKIVDVVRHGHLGPDDLAPTEASP